MLVNWSHSREETACDSCRWDETVEDTNMTSRRKMAAALPHPTATAQPLSFCFVYLFVRFSWLFALFSG